MNLSIQHLVLRTSLLKAGLILALMLSGLGLTSATVEAACTPTAGYTVCQQFVYNGADQTFTVPTGITSIDARVFGAAGGGYYGGLGTWQIGGAGGGFTKGTIAVTPGQVLTIVAGGGGAITANTAAYGGGGVGGTGQATTQRGSGGGGMSAIFKSGGNTQASALLIAGGGGGSAAGTLGTGTASGGGGGLTGGQGSYGGDGKAGTQSAGGAAGGINNCAGLGGVPQAGSQLQGGSGAFDTQGEGGGGGGGGWYGGGGGTCEGGNSNSNQNGQGGGGSSYYGGTGVSNASTTAGSNFVWNGDGTANGCSGTAASGGASDALYVAGVGVGTCNTAGGNGMVVIQYNAPTVKLVVTSIGGTSAFPFSGTNGWSSQTITTATAGTAVSGTATAFTSAATATTITEAIPSGYSMTSAYCTGLNGGTATYNLSGGTISFDNTAMAAGNAITCNITNTATSSSGNTPVTIPAGSYSYLVPANVTRVQAKVAGAGGGSGGYDSQNSGAGGTGAFITSTMAVTPGSVISGTIGAGGQSGWSSGLNQPPICSGNGAGGGGFSNGGNGAAANCAGGGGWSGGGGGGGGSTSLSLGSTNLMQAAGGGGGGGSTLTIVGGSAGSASAATIQATCGTVGTGASSANAQFDGGGGGGGGGGYNAGTAGVSVADGGVSPGGGGAGNSCTSSNAAVLSAAVASPATGGSGAPAQTSVTTTSPSSGSNGFVTISPYPLITLNLTTIGGVGGFRFVSDVGGFDQSISTVTPGTPVTGPVYGLTVFATPIIISLTPVSPNDVMTSASCTSSTGGAPSSNLATGKITLDATSTALGANITCNVTMTRLPTITLTMVSNGNVGPFTFNNGTNGWADQTITTITSGTGVSGAKQTLTTPSTATSITQVIPAGYTFTSVTCAGMGTGTVTPNLTSGAMAFDANATAPGNAITCTVTDTKTPTLKTKVRTLGNFGGPFSFGSQVNLVSAPANITTTVVGANAPPTPLAIVISNVGQQVQLTETPATGYALTAVSCLDANGTITGNTGTFGTFSGNVLTIPAANVLAGADISCTWTNAKTPTLKLQVTSLIGVGTFTPTSQTNLKSLPPAITTTITNTVTPNSPTGIEGSTTGTAITVTLSPATNFAMIALSCTDANATLSGNPSTAFGSFSGSVMTVPATNIVNGADITCVATESKTQAAFKLVSVGNFGSFAFASSSNLNSTPGTIITTAVNTATPASPTPVNVTTAGTDVTITQAASVGTAGYTLTSMSCTDANGSVTGNSGSFGTVATFTGTIPAANVKPGSDITCVITNTKTPTFKLQIFPGLGFGGPFSFVQTNLASNPVNITTTVAVTKEPASPVAIDISSLATAVTVTGTPPAGFDLYAATCADANSAITGNTGNFITFASNVLTVPATNIVAGADLTCVMNSHRFPLLTIKETTTGLGGTFSFTGTNGWTSQSIGPTVAGTPLSGAAQFLTAINTATSLTQSANPAFVLSSVTCTDSNSTNTGMSGSFGTLTGVKIDIPTANIIYGADIVCAFANTAANPTLTILKTAARTKKSDGTVVNVALTDANGLALGVKVNAGEQITYTYAVKNTGFVPITGVSVSDIHGGKNISPGPGNLTFTSKTLSKGTNTQNLSADSNAAKNIYDTLGPDDTVTFTATYTVIQQDVDLLQ